MTFTVIISVIIGAPTALVAVILAAQTWALAEWLAVAAFYGAVATGFICTIWCMAIDSWERKHNRPPPYGS
jgi:hypothetical protein